MKLTALVCALLVSAFIQAQKIAPLIIDVSAIEVEHKTPIPFAAVQIIDARFDRNGIGCVNKIRKANNSFIRFGQTAAFFPDSLHRYLPQVMQKLFVFDAASNDTLVLLVKQFRLSDRIVNRMNLEFEPQILLRLSFSAFAFKENQFTKLFGVDDLFTKKLPTDRIPKEDVMSDFRNEALLLLLQQVMDKKDWQSKAARFALPVVQQGLYKRFQLPLFTDSVLRSGVYRSFQEFKQNAPSLINVKLGMNKDRVVSLKDSAGNELDPKQYWGVCSGKKFFIVFRGEFCELSPSDRSFYFLSYVRHSDLYGMPSFGDYAPQTGLLGAGIQKARENRMFRHYFFLNMDEETLYLEDVFGKSSLKDMQQELLK